MKTAYFVLGAAFLALSPAFYAKAGGKSDAAAVRKGRLVGGLFAAAGLLFILAGLIAYLNAD